MTTPHAALVNEAELEAWALHVDHCRVCTERGGDGVLCVQGARLWEALVAAESPYAPVVSGHAEDIPLAERQSRALAKLASCATYAKAAGYSEDFACLVLRRAFKVIS